MSAKLIEYDDKIQAVRDLISDLERLEHFLMDRRAAEATRVQAGYLTQVRVSQQEVDAQMKRARELIAKWKP